MNSIQENTISKSLINSIEYAMKLHRQGQLKKAEKHYRKILKKIPNHPDVLHFLGVLLHQLGKSDTSLDYIHRAIQQQPDYVDAYNNLGNVYKELGKPELAQIQYNKAILLQERPDFLYNLGVVLRQQNRYQEAADAYKRAITLQPKYADAWYNLGGVSKMLGEVDAALTAYRQAALLKPQDSKTYQHLGKLLYASGRADEAEAVYKQWLTIDPDNPVASHMLAACSGATVPERASDDYVRQTFDKFAENFDESLKSLEYCAPALLAGALQNLYAKPAGNLHILDAGCGTGLCAEFLRPFCNTLVGVDLSNGMLEKAKQLKLYDQLIAAELTEYLLQQQQSYDLILSADTLCYFGNLQPVFQAACGAMKSNGYLLFTLEKLESNKAGLEFRLNPHGRYSHNEKSIRCWLSDNGFTILSIGNGALRKEAATDVMGMIVVAQKK